MINKNKPLAKNLLIWFAVFTAAIFIYDYFGNIQAASSRIAFSDFLQQIDAGTISQVNIRGDIIEGTNNEGKPFSTQSIEYPNLVDKLMAHSVKFEVVPTETTIGTLFAILLSWFPLVLLIGVWVFFMRQMQGGGGAGKAMGFGKSKARMLSDKNNTVTFADVAGIDEAKMELTEIVDFLRDPGKFQKLGGKIPKGCLLIGSPGTGKTLLARAIAGEAKVPFFSISGSDFVEMFVGVGASRVRDMFEQAKKHSPCIIFIDEIDAVGRHRGAGIGGGNDEREQTLNQLLVEMDGFTTNQGVIVVAATNRPDVLDHALLRPGRFDRQITVPAPDINGREQILKVHAAKVKLETNVDLRIIARGTPGFSGADLANLVNESALLAARRNRNMITMDELEEAKDKVMMGAERRSMVMTDKEKGITAYHEAGHAIISVYLPVSDPIHKATIMPRGRALGMVMRLPVDDGHSVTKEKLLADIAIAMGGRVAEELVYGADKITTGASSDIKMATSLAYRMVTEWGMSDKIGPILINEDRKDRSEQTTSLIDGEVKKIIDEGYKLAIKIITDHKDQFDLLAKTLLEYETLTGDEVRALIKEGKIDRKVEEPIIEPISTFGHPPIKQDLPKVKAKRKPVSKKVK